MVGNVITTEGKCQVRLFLLISFCLFCEQAKHIAMQIINKYENKMCSAHKVSAAFCIRVLCTGEGGEVCSMRH